MMRSTLDAEEMIADGGAAQELRVITARLEAWQARAVTLDRREFFREYEHIITPLLARANALSEQLTVALAVHEARKAQAKGHMQ